jgi:hypothetical protein
VHKSLEIVSTSCKAAFRDRGRCLCTATRAFIPVIQRSYLITRVKNKNRSQGDHGVHNGDKTNADE